jgi:hypothetical protein
LTVNADGSYSYRSALKGKRDQFAWLASMYHREKAGSTNDFDLKELKYAILIIQMLIYDINFTQSDYGPDDRGSIPGRGKRIFL